MANRKSHRPTTHLDWLSQAARDAIDDLNKSPTFGPDAKGDGDLMVWLRLMFLVMIQEFENTTPGFVASKLAGWSFIPTPGAVGESKRSYFLREVRELFIGYLDRAYPNPPPEVVKAWAGVFFLEGRWYAVGGQGTVPVRLLGVGERTVCLAQANDWLNDLETDDAAHKSRRWLSEVPTENQLRYLPPALRADFGLTRYQASALLTFQFNKHAIQRVVHAANQRHLEAA